MIVVEIQSGQEGAGRESLVLMIAGELGKFARTRRQIGCGIANGRGQVVIAAV
jgi:hypothetical protein